jgi:uncharacterized protein
MRKLDVATLVLTSVGGLNWGLVGLFRFDLVAAIFGGMGFGETNPASRVVYTLVGLSAAYLLGRIRALVGGRDRVPAAT